MAEDDKKKQLLEKIKKSDEAKINKNIEEASVLLSTRSKLERDYDEDKIEVVFSTSPMSKGKILARRPTNKEMITIMMLSAQAAKYEGSADPESLIKMIEIYKQLSTIAADFIAYNNLLNEKKRK